MFALAVPVMAAQSSSEVTNYGDAPWVASVTIDGTIDDAWAQATAYPINLFTDGPGSDLTGGTFKVMWNESTLFVLFDVPDDTPNYDHNDAHQRDGVEVKFDLRNLKTDSYEDEHQFRMTAFRDGSEMSFNEQSSVWDGSEFTIAYNDTPTRYIVEMAVDMAKFPLSAGMVLGLDFQINDNAEDAGRSACLAWNDDENQAWQNPSFLGNITLLEPSAANESDAAGGGEEADATTPLPRPTPRTGDAGIMALITIMAIAAAGIVVIRRKAVK
jgi:hypothetical protein